MIDHHALRSWYRDRGYGRLADAAADVGCSTPLMSLLLSGKKQRVLRETAERFARRGCPLEAFGYVSRRQQRATRRRVYGSRVRG